MEKPLGQPAPECESTGSARAAAGSGPILAAHGAVRWRMIDLVQWILDEFAVLISILILSRDLRAMDYRKLATRPRHHAQDADAIPAL